MVSVVIPVYNVEKYLRQCIDSVLSQSYNELEVVLVDDGSTDSCGLICDEYAKKDSRVKVIHQKNGGLSRARNTGTDYATGEFVLYLDSDDYLEENAVFTLTEMQNRFSADIVVACYYYTYSSHEDINLFGNKKPILYSADEAVALLMDGTIQTFAWGKLIKTSIAKKHAFPPDTLFEDHFWTHLVFYDAERILCIPSAILHYRQREDSISFTYDLKRLDIVRGWEVRICFLSEKYPDLVAKYLSRCACDTVMLAWLVCRKMYCAKNAYRIVSDFSLKYKLKDYCDIQTKPLLSALGKNRILFAATYLIYKIKEKIICH